MHSRLSELERLIKTTNPKYTEIEKSLPKPPFSPGEVKEFANDIFTSALDNCHDDIIIMLMNSEICKSTPKLLWVSLVNLLIAHKEKLCLNLVEIIKQTGSEVTLSFGQYWTIFDKANDELLAALTEIDLFPCPLNITKWPLIFLHAMGASYPGGYCLGVGNAAIEAHLIEGGYHAFNYHFKEMFRIFTAATDEVCPYLSWFEFKTFNTMLKDQDLLKRLGVELRKLVDKSPNKTAILATLDKLIVYQNLPDEVSPNPRNLQNVRKSQSLVESLELSACGGRVELLSTSGVFSQPELTSYFKCLREFLNAPGFPHPIAIAIQFFHEPSSHYISLGYDNQKKQWLFNDSNYHVYLDNDQDAVEFLFYIYDIMIYQDPKEIIFATQIFSKPYNNPQEFSKNDLARIKKLEQFAASLSQHPIWKQIHAINQHKLDYRTGIVTWMKLAQYMGQDNIVDALVTARYGNFFKAFTYLSGHSDVNNVRHTRGSNPPTLSEFIQSRKP